MGYLSCTDAAKAMGITVRRIQQMCKRGEIPGASKEGRVWLIPESAILPYSDEKKKPLPIQCHLVKALARLLPFRQRYWNSYLCLLFCFEDCLPTFRQHKKTDCHLPEKTIYFCRS